MTVTVYVALPIAKKLFVLSLCLPSPRCELVWQQSVLSTAEGRVVGQVSSADSRTDERCSACLRAASVPRVVPTVT